MTPALEAWMDGARVARLEAPAQIAHFILAVAPKAVALERGSDSVQKVLFTRRPGLPSRLPNGSVQRTH